MHVVQLRSSDRAVGEGTGPHQHAEDREGDGRATEGAGVLERHACRLAHLVRLGLGLGLGFGLGFGLGLGLGFGLGLGLGLG